ncbi:MAG: hypothetical protein P8168_07820 [Deltaproteobacteria bacterium]|jgi:hypothetical protein
MRIRDLKWKELPAWPPAWWMSDEGAGETGVLQSAQLRYDQTPPSITVVATHLGESRNGVILLEGLAYLEILCNKLKDNVGRPLAEIGDLDIDIFASRPKKKGPKQVRPQIPQDYRGEGFSPPTAKLK